MGKGTRKRGTSKAEKLTTDTVPNPTFEEEGRDDDSSEEENESPRDDDDYADTAFDVEPPPRGGLDCMVANQRPVTDQDMADLTGAFGACDIDGNEVLDTEELHIILRLLGASVLPRQCTKIIETTNETFLRWCEEHGLDSSPGFLYEDPFEDSVSFKGGAGTLDQMKAWNPLSQEFENAMKHNEMFSRFYADHVFMLPRNVAVKNALAQAAQRKVKGVVSGAKNLTLDLARATPLASSRPEAEEQEEQVVPEGPTLHFKEFVFLMNSNTLQDECGLEEWHTSARDMIKFRMAFDRGDVDGNNELTMDEFETVLLSTNPELTLDARDLEKIWKVLVPKTTGGAQKEGLDFMSFLEGIINLRESREFNWVYQKIAEPNKFALLSLLIDAPVSEAETDLLLSQCSMIERKGIQTMIDMRTKERAAAGTLNMSKEEATKVLQRVVAGQVHYDQHETKPELEEIHKNCVLMMGFVGLVTCGLQSVAENFGSWYWNTDGIMQLNATTACMTTSIHDSDNQPGTAQEQGMCYSPFETILKFWALNGPALLISVIVELIWLMVVAVRHCAMVAPTLKLRLVPLNKDRSFVARAIVGAAFELGSPENPVMGVDPNNQSDFQRKLRLVFMIVLFKLKVVITGGALGFLAVKILTATNDYATGVYVKQWMDVIATVGWDMFVGHSIMHEVRLRGLGFITAIEVFNEILRKLAQANMQVAGGGSFRVDDDLADTDPAASRRAAKNIPEHVKIALATGIGVAIVKHGSMYAPMEMLLRHVVQYLGLCGHYAVTQGGVIDDETAFLTKVSKLRKHEQLAVLQAHLLTYVLDGDLNKAELELWQQLCEVCHDDVCNFYPTSMRMLSMNYRDMNFALTPKELRKSFDPELQDEVEVDPNLGRKICIHKCFECLTL